MKLMLASLHRLVSVCAALPLCMPVVADAHALPVLRSVRIDSSSQDALTLGQPSAERLAYVQGDEADPAMADGAREEDDDNDVTYGVDDYHDDVTYGVDDYQIMDGDEDAVMDDGTSFRKLLHGCHGDSRCRRSLSGCPRCRFPGRNSTIGHCRRGGRLQICRRNLDRTQRNSTGVVLAAEGLGLVGPAECPSIHASTLPGHFSVSPDYANGDYEVETVEVGYVVNAFGYSDDIDIVPSVAPEFATVSDSRGLQRELQVGTTHIMVTQHMDLTQVSLPDLPTQFLTLDNPAVRVLNTTLSIAGRCDGPPPDDFNLTEPLPPGACALRVREDFLDAPSGTTCLLLDSLYVLVAPRAEVMTSSVLILHIDGLMWINNCVFQGAGLNGRAIDMNTDNGRVDGRTGRPSLYIKDTTFTGFTRSLAPGIRARRSSRLWLDNCVFRDITLTPALSSLEIQASAIAAESNVELIIVNTTFVDNMVFGEPAGDRAVAISPNRTEILASPQMRVWVWPDGPFVMTDPNVGIAESIITGVVRPILESILDITQEIATRGLARLERRAEAD